ncbi:hypothetical protein Tco_1540339 [Tanacetum coccineum]
MKEVLPSMIGDQVNKITKKTDPLYVAEGLLFGRKKTQADVAAMIAEAVQKERENLHVHPTLVIKFEKITTATPCQTSAIRPRDHEDHQEYDARLEGESKQFDDFDARMEDVGTYDDDDDVPAEEVSHELLEEMSGENNEDQMQNYLKSGIVWESRKERLYLLSLKKPAPVVQSFQRDPKAPPMTLLNQDLFYLKYGNSGMESYQQKVNLTALTITFPGIKGEKLFTINSEPVICMIYEITKKEKRVMIHKEIHKFCNATLKRVLEKLKKYNKDLKYGYANLSPSDGDVEYLQFYEEDIEDRLKHRDQMRRWEIYVNGRPLGSRRDHPE